MTVLNFFALACFCFLLKVASALFFKPLTARWFTVGIAASVILGHLLLLGLIHIGLIDMTSYSRTALYELMVFYLIGTSLLSLIPLNLVVLPFLYWRDKRIASNKSDDSLQVNSSLRIPENAFHALTFSGGYIGAWIGQTKFHHKVSKQSFRIKHYIICFISITLYAGLGYLFYTA